MCDLPSRTTAFVVISVVVAPLPLPFFSQAAWEHSMPGSDFPFSVVELSYAPFNAFLQPVEALLHKQACSPEYHMLFSKLSSSSNTLRVYCTYFENKIR